MGPTTDGGVVCIIAWAFYSSIWTPPKLAHGGSPLLFYTLNVNLFLYLSLNLYWGAAWVVSTTVPFSSETRGYNINPWFSLLQERQSWAHRSSLPEAIHHSPCSMEPGDKASSEGAQTPPSRKKKNYWEKEVDSDFSLTKSASLI